MLSKNQAKTINSLKLKKFRLQHQLFIVEGEKMVKEVVNSSFSVKEIFCLPEFADTISTNTKLTLVNEKELKTISQLSTPNKALALVELPGSDNKTGFEDDLSIVLDNIQDPGNLGTIIRTAAWFGIKNIICSPGTADVFNPKVIQSTMGAIFRTKIIYTELPPLLLKAQKIGLPIYGTLLTGENMYSQNLEQKGLIIMGNESKGISEELQSLISHPLRIPEYPTSNSNVESLNVGIACAIVCSEFRRRIS